MNRNQKVDSVKDITEGFDSSSAVYVTYYRGLTVKQLGALREKVAAAGGRAKVAKNTLVRRAIAGTPLEGHGSEFNGPNLIIFAGDDAVGTAKAIVAFAKEYDKFELRFGLLPGGERVDIKAMSSVPSRDESLAKLMYLFNYPLQGMANVLSAVPRDLVTVLKRIEEQKQN